MSDTLKYILYPADAPLLVETPILFPSWLSHKVVADACATRSGWPRPVAAGFVRATADGVVTFGESDTLGLTSRPSDATFIEPFFI